MSLPTLPSDAGAPDWARLPACPRVDRFRLGPELGRGGMGQVHLAWDPLLHRRVALKRLRGGDEADAQRFLREAEHQALIAHPHICPIYEVGREEGAPFIVMHYIEGVPLSELRAHLPAEEAARILADVAGAVHAAHRANLVHRDLKPHNILVERREDGTHKPWVVDFGLARDFTKPDLTLTWAFSGTPAFMSPAQAMGESPTPADDIFSLGATLYAVLTGLPPYEATTVAGLLDRHRGAEARALRTRRSDLPRDLDTIVMTCLEAEPQRRYASAFELESDLRRFLAGEPVLARPVSPAYRLWRRLVRYKALSLTAATSLLAVSLLVAWNLRTRAQAARQAELATRFGLEVKGFENLMRLERLMPPHDLRPAEASLREGMTLIRREMEALGRAGRGPGHYALGRIHLALREDEAALRELEAAWAAGFRAPEAAYALGMALANLYERDNWIETRGITSPEARAEVQQRLLERWGRRALACFAQSQGQVLDHPALGQARIAWIQGDAVGCARKCREALAAVPWLFEARGLEAEATLRLGYDAEARGDFQERRLRQDQTWAILEEGMRRAPSDENLLRRAMALIGYQATRESSEGHPTEAPFEAGEALYAKALLIKPGDPGLVDELGVLRMRRGVLLASRGRDPRPLYRAALALAEAASPPGQIRRDSCIPNLTWFLGSAQWLWGEDPRPTLARARTLADPGSDTLVELDIAEARFRLARGLDPSPLLDSASAALARVLEGNPRGFYQLQMGGEICALRAQWELGQGRDPSVAVRAGLETLDRSQKANPGNVYAWWDRALLETVAAAWAASRGDRPEPALGRALRAAERGMALRGDHYRSVWTLAEVHLTEARILVARGASPAGPLAHARAALAKGLAANRTNFLLHQAQAEVELLDGRPREAEAAARRGLATKADAADLWRLLARAHRAQAGDAGRAAQAEAALRRVRALGAS